MKKYDILALGELNIDLLLNNISGFPQIGKEIFAGAMNLTLGSSTAIFAANAATLGAKVAFLGMVGADAYGDLVKASLRERGVDVSNIMEVQEAATGLTVILNYGNDRANVTYPGAMSLMGVRHISPELISRCRCVHISSIFLQRTLHDEIFEIVKLVKSAGASLSMDVQFDPEEKWDFDWRAILPMVDIFLPNEQELMCITGERDVESAMEAIRPYINAAVIKMGTKGSCLITRESKTMLAAVLNDEVVDAIGAGDSFNAGFLTAFVAGKSLEECQRTGNLTGAVNTTASGGTGAFSSKSAVEEVALKRFGQSLDL
ncbi:MAG: carbohydrate kinase family protein [Candidatus Cryptobacteroides sp.]